MRHIGGEIKNVDQKLSRQKLWFKIMSDHTKYALSSYGQAKLLICI